MNTAGITKTGSSAPGDGVGDAFRNVDLKQFLNLMIKELQNQDPLNPTDSQQLLEQINVMHQIASSDKLHDTLTAMLLGQNLANAGNLIGQTVKALDDNGSEFTGVIDRVSVTDGVPKLHSQDRTASITNIREIQAATPAS